MQHSLAPTSPVRLPSRVRRLTVLALGLCVARSLAALGTVAVQATFASADGAFAPERRRRAHPRGHDRHARRRRGARDRPARSCAARSAASGRGGCRRRRPLVRGDERLAQRASTSSGCSRTRSSSTAARRSRGSSSPRPTGPATSPAMPSTSRRSTRSSGSSSTAPATASARPTRTSAGTSNSRPSPGACAPR